MAAGEAPLSCRAAARLPAGVRVLGRTPNGLLVGLYGACTRQRAAFTPVPGYAMVLCKRGAAPDSWMLPALPYLGAPGCLWSTRYVLRPVLKLSEAEGCAAIYIWGTCGRVSSGVTASAAAARFSCSLQGDGVVSCSEDIAEAMSVPGHSLRRVRGLSVRAAPAAAGLRSAARRHPCSAEHAACKYA